MNALLPDYIAVISDFDDTILDNQPGGYGLHDRARLDALRKVGEAHDIASLVSLPAEVNAVAFDNTPIYSIEGAFWWLLVQAKVVSATSSFDATHPLITELVDAKAMGYHALLATEAREVPGARAFFGALHRRGFENKLAIASAGHKEHILTFLNTHGFSDYFLPHHIVSREEIKEPKPHPEAFITAMRRLGVRPSMAHKVLAFEDDPRGIVAAKRAGLVVCGVTTTFSADHLLAQEIPPDFIAADFVEYAHLFNIE